MKRLAAVLAALVAFQPQAGAGNWVKWERAIAKYGHQGSNMGLCPQGCILPTTWDKDTELVVVTVERSNLMLLSDVPVVEYVESKDDKAASHKCACKPNELWRYVYNPWGRISSLFLRFLSEYYTNLPKHLYFADGQHQSWHQSLPPKSFLEMIKPRLTDGEGDLLKSPNKVVCHDFPVYCKKKSSTARRFWSAYDALVPGALEGMKLHTEYDSCLATSFKGKPCCAEYALSRAVALRRPRTTYTLLYTRGIEFTALKNKNEYLSRLQANLNTRFASHVMEYLWPFIFARSPAALVAEGPTPLPTDATRCTGRKNSSVVRMNP